MALSFSKAGLNVNFIQQYFKLSHKICNTLLA
ncbi:hypothetical protein SAMN06269173_1039 [Hymenobacter mucosus]|uniref:Uncharacterized protein n=1 Tax=Hymenobacter mucosus TaxID=1411120 RepID=A0A238WRG0_9BACT|nr:hypothetical protein SAMN06269173_1039 [Hymenobacter mucosus]